MAELNAHSRWNYVPEEMLDATLSEGDQAEFADIFSRIMQEKERVAQHAHARCGELLAWNQSGRRPPLFWCFNNWAEPVLLANRLSRDQPLYAMHSFHSFTERWQVKGRFTEALANRYLGSVAQVAHGGQMMFGGNCQGAPIAESMAIQLSGRSDRAPVLITLDYIAKRGYRGPRLMLFGDGSDFNPFRGPGNPVSYWREKQDHFAWAVLDATHGGYFREPTVGVVAGILEDVSAGLERTGQGPLGEFRIPVPAESPNGQRA